MIVIIILGAGVLVFIIDQYWREKYIECIDETTYWQKETDFWMRKFSWMYGKYLEKEWEMIEMSGRNNHESNIS